MELVGAKPLHLLTQTVPSLKSPTGAFIASQTLIFRRKQIIRTHLLSETSSDYFCLVRVARIELTASWSQTRRSSQAEPHPEGFVCVLSVTQELVYSKGKNMSTTFFIFFIFFLKWLPVSLKRASRQAFYPHTLQPNAYTLDHLHKHLFHGAKSLASMAYSILLLGSKLCRRAAVLI